MKRNHLLIVGAFCLCTSALSVANQEIDLDFVDGSHWSTSSDEQKEAYLVGVGNLLELEQAMHGAGGSGEHSVVPVLIKGLSPMTLDQVKEAISLWYEAHPDQSGRAVLEVLYAEIALPNN